MGAKPVDSDCYFHTYPRPPAISRQVEPRPPPITTTALQVARLSAVKSERRQDNRAATPSRFGGLWTDVGNALKIISGRCKVRLITWDQAAILTTCVPDGYVILPAHQDATSAPRNWYVISLSVILFKKSRFLLKM